MAGKAVVEVLTSGGCPHCAKLKKQVKDVIADLDDQRVQYREVDIVEWIDYAVKLGVRRTPAVAVNGKLLAEAVPTEAQLRRAVRQYLNQEDKT